MLLQSLRLSSTSDSYDIIGWDVRGAGSGRISNVQRLSLKPAKSVRVSSFVLLHSKQCNRSANHHGSHIGKGATAFWGYQNTTLLEEEFAALFPLGFDHLILDGVVDGGLQYAFGDVLLSSIQDIEKVF